MNLVSLFSGAGGLDKGFENAGFNIIWANEYDKTIWDTYRYNFPGTFLNTNSIVNIQDKEVPNNIISIIGEPPCQSWSLAGTMKGINDKRGRLFYDYLRILNSKRPLFFVVENVPGMLSKRHIDSFLLIINMFDKCGYKVSYEILNAWDFGVPQIRKRLIIVGYRKDLNIVFDFEKLKKADKKPVLQDVIKDLPIAMPTRNKTNKNLLVPNHEYLLSGFSSIYMSRNRKKSWNEPSFTILASARHIPLHPDSSEMIKIDKDKWVFKSNYYRRLSVRECARIQTFPDDFIFLYKKITDGYKMVGNAVPVKLVETIAEQIKKDLDNFI